MTTIDQSKKNWWNKKGKQKWKIGSNFRKPFFLSGAKPVEGLASFRSPFSQWPPLTDHPSTPSRIPSAKRNEFAFEKLSRWFCFLRFPIIAFPPNSSFSRGCRIPRRWLAWFSSISSTMCARNWKGRVGDLCQKLVNRKTNNSSDIWRRPCPARDHAENAQTRWPRQPDGGLYWAGGAPSNSRRL